jgi:hypothetical protein
VSAKTGDNVEKGFLAVVMAAANDAGAAALAKRFQILAARAANLLEKLGEKGSR